jgi:hypothetical protein
VTKGNVSLLFNGEIDNGHSDAPFPVEEEERLIMSDEVCYLNSRKNFM